ncbi:E3 ubiquitin-protein ligase ATL42-like [Musa acuminata AAA Group]|uniref:E3 ubiquitin-protein ligase ATL42-like n=1 Tax=Musa acuminata AAA Group TaxID=214697 RepID=UPI0031D911CB
MPSETCAASFTYFFFFSFAISAAQQTDAVYWSPPNVAVSFRPSVALVIGIFALMFFLTFLLIYGKVCHSAAAAHATDLLVADAAGHGRFILPQDRFSGIDRTVIESLPFFRFSSLRGVRDGLECAVCLSKFDDAEVLRLLPKCKHAFHVRCVDRWLEAHSSCPVCRCMVNADDDGLFKYSTSSRFLFASDRLEASGRDLELFVEREPNDARNLRGSSGFSISSSFRNTDKWRELPTLEEGASGGRILHKFKHKIIVSDVVFKSRWSDVNSSDLISLDLEMLSGKDVVWNVESTRSSASEGKASPDDKLLRIKEEMEKKRLLEIKASQINKNNSMSVPSISSSGTNTRALISSGNRSMSDITNVSRFMQLKDPGNSATHGDEDEKARKLWLPIARRTVQWFAGRERRSQMQCSRRESPGV